MLGWVAPVMAMVSPSQPSPAVNQRMSISRTGVKTFTSAARVPEVCCIGPLPGTGRFASAYCSGFLRQERRRIVGLASDMGGSVLAANPITEVVMLPIATYQVKGTRVKCQR
jgi:hypothetical protein